MLATRDVLEAEAASVMLSVRFIGVSELDQRTAVLIKVFSGRSDLALHWIRLQQLSQWKWRPGLAALITEDSLAKWVDQLSSDTLVQRCRRSSAAELSGTVREFLVESLLAEKVREFAAMGLVVPSGYLVDTFLKMLRMLPDNVAHRRRIESLTESVNSCKKWSSRFRFRWQLEWGSTVVPHGVTESAAERRTGIFLRWLRFWFQHAACPAGLIVVNMDETMLGSIKDPKVGVVSSNTQSRSQTLHLPARAPGLPRTSLVASVCNDAEVQKVLPQIRLPKSSHGRCPSKRALANYADAGVPVITWHGSAGWVSADILQWYLRKLSAAVRSVRPGAALLLVWDCCPVHMSNRVLQTARRCRIHIVFVPGRMTWALQPLDTHVFAVLKQLIRKKEFAAKAEARSNKLAPGLRVRLHGEAIRDVLVHRSWVSVMQRAGLACADAVLRPSVVKLAGHEPSSAAMPSVTDVMEIFAVEEPRAVELLRLLKPLEASTTGDRPRLCSVAPSSQQETQQSVSASAPWSPTPVVLTARLPSGPRAGPHPLNVWLPFFAGRTVRTRSMTVAARAQAALQPAPASASSPSAKRPRT